MLLWCVMLVPVQVLSAADGFEVELLSLWQVMSAPSPQTCTASHVLSCKYYNTHQNANPHITSSVVSSTYMAPVKSHSLTPKYQCRQRHNQSSSTKQVGCASSCLSWRVSPAAAGGAAAAWP